VATMTVANTSPDAWVAWSGSFTISLTATVVNSWGARLGIAGTSGWLTPAAYNTPVGPGRTVTIGFQGATSAPATQLSGMRVKGHPCSTG